MIRVYQACISPLLVSSCRFHPSCSSYALDAIKIQGLLKGSFLVVWRILRCHPWCQGGFDPVPEKNSR